MPTPIGAKYQEPKVEFTKIQFNVPKKLLEEFETIAYLNHYSRVEGFKEAMRQFVVDQTPDDYSNAEDMKNYWRQTMDAILEVSQDPKYHKLNIDPNTMVSHTTKTSAEDKTEGQGRINSILNRE